MKIYLGCFVLFFCSLFGTVSLGVDVLFENEKLDVLKNRRIGLVINQTSLNSSLRPTFDLFKENSHHYSLVALFSLEHGLHGAGNAGDSIPDTKNDKIPVYSLHGETRRPTTAMLKNIDLLVFDVQEIGSRSYTYATTLFYLMEEAAKHKIKVLVLDRPNPINGIVVDGPMLKEEFRSFRGYINVPYCHGMTIGELSKFFNEEYKVGCDLNIIKMRNWDRKMSYSQTGLHWTPTSPYIPEADTCLFYPITGTLGELGIINIGIGYTQPFKLIGAPWIHANDYAQSLNAQKLPGIKFLPYHFKPYYGIYADQECHGVKIIITDAKIYRPIATQYLILGTLKSLYPKKMEKLLSNVAKEKLRSFNLVNGNEITAALLLNEKYFAWKLIELANEQLHDFSLIRQKYLLY